MTTATAPAQNKRGSGQAVRPRLLLATLLSGLCMANLDLAIVNVATPSIHDTLGASGAELQLVVSAYVVSYAMLLIAGARLGESRGYGRVFVAGAAIFTAASLGCGVAPNAFALVAARAIQGVGGALMVAQVLSGIQVNFSGEARIRALGAYALALSGGAVVGQVLGGVVVGANLFDSAWRPAFLINVPLGLALILVAMRALPMHRPSSHQRLDIGGLLVLSIAVLLLIVPLTLGREAGWPLWSWAMLGLSVLVGAAFVRVEQRAVARGDQPLVNLAVLARPNVAWGLTAAGAAIATYYAVLFVLAQYLQQGRGQSPVFSGIVLVSWVAAFGISGPILSRIGARRIAPLAVVGYIILAAAYGGLCASLVLGQADNNVLLVALLGLGGLGLGLGRNATVVDMTTSTPSRFAADMSGLINTDSQLAGAAGVALFGTLYLSLAPHGGEQPAVDAFKIVTAAFGVTALLAAAAAYRSLVLRQPIESDGSSPGLIDRAQRFARVRLQVLREL